jgi:preprotein translocase subunit SecG
VTKKLRAPRDQHGALARLATGEGARAPEEALLALAPARLPSGGGRPAPTASSLGAAANAAAASAIVAARLNLPTIARTVPCGAMYLVLGVVQVFLSLLLIFLVLMHSGKDSGLSGAFGVGTGAGPFGGGSLVERNLNIWTVVIAILFAANTIILLRIS